MGSRLELHDILTSIIGNTNVYFQPPPSMDLSYPCIIYERSNIWTRFADNKPYNHAKQYTVTVIDANPDSTYPDIIADLDGCSFDRAFRTDNLNHDVFTITF